jgi:hypothetical protein
MPRKVTGSELRNLKRVFVFNHAVIIMHKKKPWTQTYQNKIIFMLYGVYQLGKVNGYVKQGQIMKFLAALNRTGSPGDLKMMCNTGLIRRDRTLGVYSYQVTPKGMELLKEIEYHIKYTRIDKFI